MIHANSADFRELLASPVHSREEQGKAIAAIAAAMGLGAAVTNTLGLMAQNRRLFVVPGLLAQVKALIAAERGEVTAEVVSAKPLTKGQAEELAATLKKSVGKDVKIAATIGLCCLASTSAYCYTTRRWPSSRAVSRRATGRGSPTSALRPACPRPPWPCCGMPGGGRTSPSARPAWSGAMSAVPEVEAVDDHCPRPASHCVDARPRLRP